MHFNINLYRQQTFEPNILNTFSSASKISWSIILLTASWYVYLDDGAWTDQPKSAIFKSPWIQM